jgi:hypothetical protein
VAGVIRRVYDSALMQKHPTHNMNSPQLSYDAAADDSAGMRRVETKSDGRPLADSNPAALAALIAENHELRADVARLRAERDRLLDTQKRVMDLLYTTQPDRLVHDLRNALNERDLFKALADSES